MIIHMIITIKSVWQYRLALHFPFPTICLYRPSLSADHPDSNQCPYRTD